MEEYSYRGDDCTQCDRLSQQQLAFFKSCKQQRQNAPKDYFHINAQKNLGRDINHHPDPSYVGGEALPTPQSPHSKRLLLLDLGL